eukprot:280687_1
MGLCHKSKAKKEFDGNGEIEMHGNVNNEENEKEGREYNGNNKHVLDNDIVEDINETIINEHVSVINPKREDIMDEDIINEINILMDSTNNENALPANTSIDRNNLGENENDSVDMNIVRDINNTSIKHSHNSEFDGDNNEKMHAANQLDTDVEKDISEPYDHKFRFGDTFSM